MRVLYFLSKIMQLKSGLELEHMSAFFPSFNYANPFLSHHTDLRHPFSLIARLSDLPYSGYILSVTVMPGTPEPAPAPTRDERKACWSHRDSYFACLTQNGVTIPPGTDMSDGRGPVGKAAKEEQEKLAREKSLSAEESRRQDPCIEARHGYESNCARSWVSASLQENPHTLQLDRLLNGAASVGGPESDESS